MSNVFLNVDDITGAALASLESNLVLARFVNKQYDDRFKQSMAKPGDTANVRVPGNFAPVRSGRVADPKAFNEKSVAVTLSQMGNDIELSTAELTLNLNDFKSSVMDPIIAPIAAKMDADGYALHTSITNVAGVPGTPSTTLANYLTAKAICHESGAPVDNNWSAFISPAEQVSLVGGLSGLFHSSTEIEQQYKEGTMGIGAGMKFSMSQNVKTNTTGAFGSSTPLINDGSIAEGDTTLVTNGWAGSSESVVVGDSFTLANVYAIDPQTRQSTGRLKQFAITAAASSSGGNMTLTFTPALRSTGVLQNINALPVTTAAIKFFGTAVVSGVASKVGPANLVLHRDALTLAHVDLVVPPGCEGRFIQSKRLGGIGIRYYQWTDGRNDTVLHRFDVCYGWALLRPEFASRVMG